MKKIFFDSVAGMLHYFVRPNDDFVLNSLEKINCDEYLYRLLKEDGYKRVVFFEVDETNCKVYAYDKLSHLSLLNPDDFSSVDLSDAESLTNFYNEIKEKNEKTASGPAGLKVTSNSKIAKTPDIKEHGKREVIRFSQSADFMTVFENYVSKALQSGNIKTAIVMQMEIFEQIFNKEVMIANNTSAQFANIIRKIEKKNNSMQNIIVFTTTSRDSFLSLINNKLLHNLHSWTAEVLSEQSNVNIVHRAISKLEECGCIVLADSIGEDELANLLLRKKIIEKDSRFHEIPVTKIYVLAGMLKNHLLQKNKRFQTIPFREVKEFVRPLNVLINQNETISELIDICSKVRPRNINTVENGSTVYVERVTHNAIQFSDISEEERMEEYNLAMAQLNSLVGLNNVKSLVQQLFNRRLIYADEMGPGHYVFAGNPGTGKTEVARIMGEIFKAQGLLNSGHLVECRKADLVADIVGGSAIKTRNKCMEALDGVLFVDEAYTLVNTEPTGEVFATEFDEDAYTEIMAFMENNRERICVIFAGYSDKMNIFINANPGMPDRITEVILFPDYTEQELYEIFVAIANKNGFTVAEDAKSIAIKEIDRMKTEGGDTFSNARAMRKLFDECTEKLASRMTVLRRENRTNEMEMQKYTIMPEDILTKNKQNVSEAMSALEELIGLSDVKRKIQSIINKVRYPANPNKRVPPGHYVFVGKPGTGKTEVARLFSKILFSIGVLSKGHLVEVSQVDLVAGYGGQTAIKTEKKCKEALGGVLFVDEAYTLLDNGNADWGIEALNTIMTFMENNRANITVIFAGYKDRMKELMSVNSGFESRISSIIQFPNYSVDELVQIMKLMAAKNNWFLEPDFVEESRTIFKKWVDANEPTFGNARNVRKYLDNADENRANRISQAKESGNPVADKAINHFVQEDAFHHNNAAPNSANSTKPKSYKMISRSIFENLSVPYGTDVTESRAKLNEATDPAVLFIKTDKGAGTAFLVSPDGYAITCNHVIEGATEINARLRIPGRPGGSDSSYICDVINTKKDYDIALIKLQKGENFPYLKLAGSDRKIIKGEEFILSGYPFGDRTAKDLTTFYGSIASSELQKDDYGYVRYNIDCQAKCGDSGAPIISTTDGCVIGILLGSITNSSGQLIEEINHMRPIRYFWKEFLK